MLDEARATIGRRNMGAGWIGARLNYLSALVAFQQKRIAEGNAALAAAMGYMQHGSLWLFHIGLADELYVSGSATPRTALDLFGDVLRDPQPADWAFDPMESLAVLITPHPLPLEHWFEAALVGAAARRCRRRSRLPSAPGGTGSSRSLEFGGRLESLRWILEAAPAYLPQQALLQRQDISPATRPTSSFRSRRRRSARRWQRCPWWPKIRRRRRSRSRQLAELAAIGTQQEAILREIAVRREPAALVFPPLRTRGRRAEIPARQTRRAGLLRHRPAAVRIPAEQRAVHALADRLAGGRGEADADDAPRHGPVPAEPRIDRQGPRRHEVEAVGPAGLGDAVEGLAGRFHAALRRTGDRARRRALVSAVRGACR